MNWIWIALLALPLVLIGLGFCGCAAPTKITHLSENYLAAINTARATPSLIPGSPAETEALTRVQRLFEEFAETNVSHLVREVYAPDAYLRDGFKELSGIDAIAPYLIASAAHAETCTFTFEDATGNGKGDYYLRWVMRFRLADDPPGQFDEALGMSHFRFNTNGLVIFQQDYWDPTDVLYKRIPVANWLIKLVKNRL